MEMQNIVEILKDFGLEIPEDKVTEFNKKVAENYKTVAEHTKATGKLQTELDGYKERAESAEETLKTFEGIEPDKVQDEIATWKKKAEDAEKDYNAKIVEREFEDTLKTEIESFKFTSELAKKAIVQEIKEAGLKVKDGKILGLNDLIAGIKEKDATAFVDEDEDKAKQNAAKFTTKLNNGTGSSEPITGDPAKMDFATYKKWRQQQEEG